MANCAKTQNDVMLDYIDNEERLEAAQHIMRKHDKKTNNIDLNTGKDNVSGGGDRRVKGTNTGSVHDVKIEQEALDKTTFNLLSDIEKCYEGEILPIIKYDGFNPVLQKKDKKKRDSVDVTLEMELDENIPTTMSVFSMQTLKQDFLEGCHYKSLSLPNGGDKQRIALLCVAYKLHAKKQRLLEIIKLTKKAKKVHDHDPRLEVLTIIERKIIAPLEPLIARMIREAGIDQKLSDKLMKESKKDGKMPYNNNISISQSHGKLAITLTDKKGSKTHKINVTKHFVPAVEEASEDNDD